MIGTSRPHLSAAGQSIAFGGYHLPLGAAGSDSAAAILIRDAAARDLFSLVGDPPPQDHRLSKIASTLLASHLRRLGAGDVDPAEGECCASANVMPLGLVDDVERELTHTGGVHAWGHFVIAPAAHAEAVAAFTARDGLMRVYIATAWRA